MQGRRRYSFWDVQYGRWLQPKPMEVQLLGIQNFPGRIVPIEATIRSLSESHEAVRGVLDFRPEDSHTDRVNGLLRTGCPAVWIEDADSGEEVTERVQPKRCD